MYIIHYIQIYIYIHTHTYSPMNKINVHIMPAWCVPRRFQCESLVHGYPSESATDTEQFTNSTDPNFPCSVHLCHFMSPKYHIQPASSYIRHSLHLALELGSQLVGLLQIGQLHALLLPWPKPPPPWQTQLQLATGPHGRHGTCCIE